MCKSNDDCKCNGTCGDNCKCQEKSLASLVLGEKATISRFIEIGNNACQKFYNIGFITGGEVLVEAFAPFGGLMRVKVMNSSVVLHKDDAANIMVK